MPKKAEPTGFDRRLKELREAAGLTQDQLAERAGLYKFSVAKLEQGIREPTWTTVLTLAKVLGVSVSAFAAEGESVAEGHAPAPATSPASGQAATNAPTAGSKRKRG